MIQLRKSFSVVSRARRSCHEDSDRISNGWWAHFEFTRINIAPAIPPNEIEENSDLLDAVRVSERP
jgi:hypothetical protein